MRTNKKKQKRYFLKKILGISINFVLNKIKTYILTLNVFNYTYYYLYRLVLITNVYKEVLIYTFKVYCYPHHVKIAISSMYNF